MTYSGCERRIENQLEKINGISDIKADYAKEIVSLTFDTEQTGLTKIVNALKDIGYQAGDANQSISKQAANNYICFWNHCCNSSTIIFDWKHIKH